MSDRGPELFEVVCPCCGARLKINAALSKVIAHHSLPKHRKAPDLDRASMLLQKEAARREALFRQSAEDEKTKTQLLERKFEEALKETRDELLEPPIRDVDLD